MTNPQWSRLVTAGGAALVVIAVTLGVLPSPASADHVTYTAQASGRALELAIGGQVVGDEPLGPRTADTDRDPSDGTNVPDCVEATSPTECRQGPGLGTYPNIPLLADILSAGVLAQDAAVDDSGNSRACAGVVGPGGLLTIDETPQPCLGADPGDPGGIMVNLVTGLPLGLLRLRVDGIYAECTATAGDPHANPPVPASAAGEGRVANIVIDTQVGFLGWVPLLTLPVSSAPNSQVLFPVDSPFAPLNQLISVRVNEQDPPPPAGPDTRTQIDVTALHVTLLGAIPGGGLVDIKAGQVSCGENFATLAAATTTTTADPGTTSTTADPGTTSTTADPGTTSTTADPGTTSTTADPGTTSTTADPGTTSTTADPGTSTTLDPSGGSTSSSSSSSSSTLASTSSTAKSALAKSGVDTRTQVSLAVGLLGLGMLITGRGRQLGFDGRRRR